MPIYEFKCLKCENFFELLVMCEDDKTEMTCPKCKSEDFEKVMSTTSFAVTGNAPGGSQSPCASSQTRTCSSGSCTTYDIPGPK